MQQRMIDLHFDPGPADGHFAQDTEYAVIALQKMSNIAPNGHVGPNEWANLQFFKYPTPLEPNGEAKRVEANITKQYLVLYENYQPKLLTTISSGGGERYCFIPLSGGRQVCDLAVTPSGRYTFYTRYTGWQKGDLGTMYNPVYWLRGWAVHGLASVPPYPASHGCIRIPIDIAKYFPSLVNNGDPIYVVGGSATAPSSVSSPLPPPAPTTTAPPVAPTTPVTAPTTT
jgi:hypothetical protein